jgi:SpoVK/Ycf46/Vps4 family AAA+-type ATPase
MFEKYASNPVPYFNSDLKGFPGADLAEDRMWMCVREVYGFSYEAKRWCQFNVDELVPPVYRPEIFDSLVMPDPNVKECVRRTVLGNFSTNNTYRDVIAKKSGGCSILLSGPPGCGKTLLAEVVAEVVRRPLYSVSVGELGTDVRHLEKELGRILHMASAWQTVLLLDETGWYFFFVVRQSCHTNRNTTELFLYKRDGKNLKRDAMCTVFLRMLEYHSGVAFLTTNRFDVLDDAVHSRILMAVRFSALEEGERRQVWENLLRWCQMPALDISRLATHPLNGREIKNVLKVAMNMIAYARDNGEDESLVWSEEYLHKLTLQRISELHYQE